MNWKYEYLIDQLHRTAYKKYENFVIGSLIHDETLSELKPCMQHYVKYKNDRYALIDLYYPQIKLAIEIDEPHHLNTKISDENRQKIIEKDLECDFFRIVIEKGDIPNQINALKNKIQTLMSDYLKNDKFEEWHEPNMLDIQKAKQDFRNTLFIKIRGEIHPDQLLSRQTCCWIISKEKQSKITQVIVVHDLFISRVFTNINWHISEENPQKVKFTGDTIEDNELIGYRIEGWNWQQTITYSNDVY